MIFHVFIVFPKHVFHTSVATVCWKARCEVWLFEKPAGKRSNCSLSNPAYFEIRPLTGNSGLCSIKNSNGNSQ